jgi:hypothetical protein
MHNVTDNETKPSISGVYNPQEMELAQKHLTEITFDCLVKMYDSGFLPHKHPPQYFKSELRLTLDFLKNSNEYAIGSAVKNQLIALMKHIEQYENGKI